MMKKYCWILLAVLSLGSFSLAAEQQLDFSGTWLLQESKVNLKAPGMRQLELTNTREVNTQEVGFKNPEPAPEAPPLAQIQKLELQVVQTGGELQVLRQFTLSGSNRSVAQKFLLDGSQCLNRSSDGLGEFVSRTGWKKKNLIHSGTLTIPEGPRTESYVTEEYSLSKNGKELTIKTTITTSRGIASLKQVFTRGDKKP